ncbi:hypothetical protein FEF27_09735 [Nesterenkonia sphaerica]|uniref:Uncharacterized protein n=1 Tax=Nesterenkonia sphaerica TaxID=1804988 RepID=A0A5R9A6D9_9MICC|nr:hypothetical protein FEF27_09735 [Nesterenkonia sphaerica]
MDKHVGSLGIENVSKSQVSGMAAELDEQVEALRTRPLWNQHFPRRRGPSAESP